MNNEDNLEKAKEFLKNLKKSKAGSREDGGVVEGYPGVSKAYRVVEGEEDFLKVLEATAFYSKSVESGHVSQAQGVLFLDREKYLLPIEPYHFVKSNISGTSLFNTLVELAGSNKKLIADLMDVDQKTIARWEKGKRDEPGANEKSKSRYVKVLELFKNALPLFKNKDAFIEWLRRDNIRFDHKAPIDVLDNDFGFDFVNRGLDQIRYGMPV